ncbi:MAG TPA: hypothetical protein VIV40_02960 [Kofleriaceae bacterium]
MSVYEELRALDDLDEPRTLRFQSTGLRLWPYVRWIAFSAAADQALGLQPAFATGQRQTLRQRARLVLRASLRGPLSLRRTFDIAVVGSSAGLVERDGRWFDRINDYFALEFADRTLVLDRAWHGAYKTPRVPPHVRCFDTFDFQASLQARARRIHDADRASIDHLLAFARDKFPLALPEPTLARMRSELEHWALRLPVLRTLYARFFDRVSPALLVIEDSSYGAFTHVNTWARAVGITTAELQHGVISRNHLAYNYGDASRTDSELAAGLPQHLLVYGEFWRDQVRTPSAIVVAGCPHFSERVSRVATGTSVLVISQGICTEAMVQLTAALAQRFPARQFVFRPHPGELALRERYQSLRDIANVEIDESSDLYARLATASVAIGHSSTALVEAAGMGVPVLLLDDVQSRAIMPADIGTWFVTAEQAAPLVESPPTRATDPTRFFAPDWRARYQAFVASVAA